MHGTGFGGGVFGRVDLCGAAAASAGSGGKGQHPATGRGDVCRAHRFVAVSRESDPGVQKVQNPAPHGP